VSRVRSNVSPSQPPPHPHPPRRHTSTQGTLTRPRPLSVSSVVHLPHSPSSPSNDHAALALLYSVNHVRIMWYLLKLVPVDGLDLEDLDGTTTLRVQPLHDGLADLAVEGPVVVIRSEDEDLARGGLLRRLE
jgi:hypothetical protein